MKIKKERKGEEKINITTDSTRLKSEPYELAKLEGGSTRQKADDTDI